MVENAANWKTFLDHAAQSDVGLRRANNQDSFAVVLAGGEQQWRQRGHLFIVADGMGAHAAGELASKLACSGIPHTYHKLLDRGAPDAIRQAIIETNANIHGRGQANAEFQGMGTTCSAIVLLPQGAVVAHVGDSRVYRLRNHRLEQLTFDHSLVWEMMAAGQLPRGDIAAFVPKNIITRSLGPHPAVQVDLEGVFPLQPGDTFMLCSDGLSGQVKDDEIGALLDALSPAEAAQALIDVANLRGGPDNITVIVVRVVTSPPESGPMTTGSSSRPAPPVHPALWVIAGVSALAAAVMGVAGSYPAAALSGLGAVIALGAVLWQKFATAPEAPQPIATGPLGKGPHTSQDCLPNAELTSRFAQMAEKLRDAAVEEQWNVDWDQFRALLEAAQQSARSNESSAAVGQYASAVSFLMSEIRHQRGKTAIGKDSVSD